MPWGEILDQPAQEFELNCIIRIGVRPRIRLWSDAYYALAPRIEGLYHLDMTADVTVNEMEKCGVQVGWNRLLCLPPSRQTQSPMRKQFPLDKP